jgi:hypothetical protein
LNQFSKRKFIDEQIDIKEEPDVKKIRNEVPDKEQLLRVKLLLKKW